MKRTLIEVAVVGGVLLLLSGFHTELRSMRSSNDDKIGELQELKTIVQAGTQEAQASVTGSLKQQKDEILTLYKDINGLKRELTRLREGLSDKTRVAERQATEAIGTSKALTRTVESTQRLLQERERKLLATTKRLEDKVRTQETLIASLRKQSVRNSPAMTTQMLSPTVQLSGEETVGSGTVIYSRPNKKGSGYDTYILTAYHVVRNILADEPDLAKEGIIVTIYRKKGTIERRGDVVTKRISRDLALVKLRGKERVDRVAKLIAPADISKLEIWTPVFAVGCPLGNDPIPTGGFVSSLSNKVNGIEYWMINAPTYFGNSGGGIYNGESEELIGVFSKIYTHGRVRPVVIPHMGLAVPMDAVYDWLRKEKYDFLVPASKRAVASPR